MRKNKRDNIVYAISIGLGLFLLIGACLKYRQKKQLLNSPDFEKVSVIRVSCGNSGRAKDFIVIRHNKSNHIVYTSYDECSNIKVGDSVELIYDRSDDLFYSKEISFSHDVAAIFSSIGVLVLILSVKLFPSLWEKFK